MSSTVDSDFSARRRRRASMACLNCRKSRIRCKVEQGQKACTQCQQTGTTCAFDSRDGRKNRANSKLVANELRKRIQHLESILKASDQGHPVPEPPDDVDYHEHLELIHAHETDTESQFTPRYRDDPPPYPDEAQQLQPPLPNDATPHSKSILGELMPRPVKFDMASGRVRFFGPTTNMHILSRTTSNPLRLPESFWPISTLVRDLSPETHDYLIDLFFDCHNSALHIVHKWAFFDDLKSGGTQFYSNFLHMTMLAEGYRYADKNRPDVKKLASIASHLDSSTFHTKAKKMAELELVRPGGIPSLQAFFLLGDLEVGIGSDDTGWMFAGMAFRLLFDVGLHVDPSDLRLTEREVQIRHMVLWACIMNDVYWALYLGRPTMLKASDIAPACLNKDFDRLIESQSRTYAYEKTIETKVYEAVLQLMNLLEPLCETRNLRKNVKPADVYLKIATMDRKLNNWYADLPERLRWTEDNVRVAPPSFYLLHTQYHTALILLHRTFPTEPDKTQNAKHSGSTHFSTLSRNVCVSNAVQVAQIIGRYKKRFAIQRIFVTGLQHVGTAATALMAEISMLQSEYDNTERSRLLEHLTDLRTAMQEMSEMYQPTVLMASVVDHFIRDSWSDDSRDEALNQGLQAPTIDFSTSNPPSKQHCLPMTRTQTPTQQSIRSFFPGLSSSSLSSSLPELPPFPTTSSSSRGTGTLTPVYGFQNSHPPFETSGGLPFLPESWFEEMNWEEDIEFLNLMGLRELQGVGRVGEGPGGGLVMEGLELGGAGGRDGEEGI